MADNSVRTPGTGENVASDELTYSGDTAKVQLVRNVYATGSEGAKTLREIHGAATPATTDYGINTREVPQVVTCTGFVTDGSDSTVISAAPCRLLSIKLQVSSAATYQIAVKCHNQITTPTPGSGVVSPRVLCQPGQVNHYVVEKGGKAFTTGLAITVVQEVADSGGTAVGSGFAIIEVEYVA